MVVERGVALRRKRPWWEVSTLRGSWVVNVDMGVDKLEPATLANVDVGAGCGKGPSAG